MRILVTGASGFVGSRLLDRLAESASHQLYALQRPAGAHHELAPASDATKSATILPADLRDPAAVKSAIREIQPEVVIHLAAISSVSYSYGHENEVMDVNLSGTKNLAEACQRENPRLKHFLFASTSEIYGNGPLPKREDTPQSPNSPYAASKLAAEKYLLDSWQASRFPVTILRAFNTYGRRDNSDYLVERMIVQMLRGDIVRLGKSTPARDLLYIDDLVDAYLACLSNPQASIGEVFNFCTGQQVTVQALAEKLRQMIGFRGEIIWDAIPPRPLDIEVMYGDPGKAKAVLGWEPKIKLEAGLSKTIELWKKKLARPEGATRVTTS